MNDDRADFLFSCADGKINKLEKENADLKAKLAKTRQETLREVMPVLKTISNVEATDSLAEMQDVVKAVKTLTTSLLHKLEAERENSDM